MSFEEEQTIGTFSEIAIKSKYEEAKSKMQDEPAEAVRLLDDVLNLSEKHSVNKYKFSAAKHIILLSSRLGNNYKMV